MANFSSIKTALTYCPASGLSSNSAQAVTTSFAEAQNLIPLFLPRLPDKTCAFTTTSVIPSSAYFAAASSPRRTTTPRGTASPCFLNNSFPSNSYKFILFYAHQIFGKSGQKPAASHFISANFFGNFFGCKF